MIRLIVAVTMILAPAITAQPSRAKTDLLNLADALEDAMRKGEWREASELSRSLQEAARTARDESMAKAGKELTDSILTWLPADTETLLVAGAPFRIGPAQMTPDSLALARNYTMGILGSAEARKLPAALAGHTVRLAALAARRFGEYPQDSGEKSGTRDPFGLIPYQGCLVIAFGGRIEESLLKRPPDESVMGHRVWTSREPSTSSQGNVTYLISFLQPDLVLACNNREFFREMVTRRGATGQQVRGLPADLAEWAYVDRGAPAWGMSHYAPGSNISRVLTNGSGDAGATGIAIAFGAGTGGSIRAQMIAKKDPWNALMTNRDLQNAARSSQISEGVWECRIDGKGQVAGYAVFMLMAALGFVVVL